MITVRLVLLVLAIFAFALAAVGIEPRAPTRFNLVAAGLFCWALSLVMV